MDEDVLLSILAEAQVLNALNVAEAVKAKFDIIEGLRERIQARELENAVRDLKDCHYTLLPDNLSKRIDGGNIVVQNFLQAAGFNQVTTMASQSRLTLHYLGQPAGPPSQPFRVLAQDPPAGAEVAPGATITVTGNRRLMPVQEHMIHLGGLTR